MTPRRVVLVITSVVVAVVIAVVVLLTRMGGGMTPPEVAPAYPSSYIVVYAVTENAIPHWEVLSVQRPFAASDLTYATAGEPRAGDAPSGGYMSTMAALYVVDSQAVHLVSGRQPGPPSGDEYVGAELGELTRRGLAQNLNKTATVAGRTCAVYRFAGPPSGAVAPFMTGISDHDDLCFDRDGLELSESWTYHGMVVLQRTAVEVQSSTGPVSDSSLPAPPSTSGAAPAGPGGATVRPDAKPASFIATPPPPSGFTAAGPAVDVAFADPQDPSQITATSVVWAFTQGARVITIEAGIQQDGGLPWSAGDTVSASVNLAGLGSASTAVRSDGFELRVDLGSGAWVRVHGTVPLDELVAYGQRLTHA